VIDPTPNNLDFFIRKGGTVFAILWTSRIHDYQNIYVFKRSQCEFSFVD